MTRRQALAAGVAAGLLGRPDGLLADPGARAAPDRLGWDDLARARGRPVRVAGFFDPGEDRDGTAAALLPCFAPVPPPPDQRLLIVGETLPRAPADILVLEATGRIEAQGARYAMAPDSLRLLFRLTRAPITAPITAPDAGR